MAKVEQNRQRLIIEDRIGSEIGYHFSNPYFGAFLIKLCLNRWNRYLLDYIKIGDFLLHTNIWDCLIFEQPT